MSAAGLDIDRERVERQFRAFVGEYDEGDQRIVLKRDHTLRVADLCERIAAAEGFDTSMRDLAWLAGMLHDVGRFEQVRTFGTFSTARSFDHATLGVHMLFDQALLADFIEVGEEDIATFSSDPHPLEMLHQAIALHSVYQLPSDLPAQTLMLCTLLRDADKIDILRVNCEFPVDSIYDFTEDDLLRSEVSPQVVEAFNERHTVQTALKKLPADYALGHCSFGWELEFPESRRIVVEQGYLACLFARPFELPSTSRVFSDASRSMFAWLRA